MKEKVENILKNSMMQADTILFNLLNAVKTV